MPRTPKPEPPSNRRQRRWASMKNTADHLDLAERTVRQMASDGRLKAYRIGRTIRFDLNEVDAGMVPFGGGVDR